MREILFRGKRTDDYEWIEGSLCTTIPSDEDFYTISYFDFEGYYIEEKVIPETVGQYTGLTDKNGKKIFEGDIVQYNTYDDFDCHSVVKFGEYNQDGSYGEYSATKCIGFYVEVDNFTCPDWCENDPEFFPEYFGQQNILEVASNCEVIGNIYDNPQLLLKVGDDK